MRPAMWSLHNDGEIFLQMLLNYHNFARRQVILSERTDIWIVRNIFMAPSIGTSTHNIFSTIKKSFPVNKYLAEAILHKSKLP